MTSEAILQLILNLRKTLHENPESSMHEIKTKKILMDFIREHTQNLEIVDRGAWFYALKAEFCSDEGPEISIPRIF